MGLRGVFQALAFLAVLFAAYFAVETVYRLTREEQQVASVDWSKVSDDFNQVLDCRWLIPQLGQPGTYIEDLLEKSFNLRIDPYFVHGESFNDARGLRFAGGDIPDIYNAYPSGFRSDYRHGFSLPVPRSLILEHGPNYVRFINEADPVAWLTTQVDGMNLGLPNIYTGGLLPRPGLWRKDWLENVGITKIPDNLPEYEEALRRLTFDDPDGDGRDNTYGMSGDVANWWWTSFAEIFGAFGVLPFDWEERDGRVYFGATLPETREALTLLAHWYEEGLIDPEFAIDNGGYNNSVERKFLNGKIGYIYYFGRYDFIDPENPGGMVHRLKEISGGTVAVGHFPEGPKGHRGGRIQGGAAGGKVFGPQVAERPELVVRFIQMADRIVTDQDLSARLIIGERGTHWEYLDPEQGAGGYRYLPPYDDSGQRSKALLAGGGFRDNFFSNGYVPLALWDRYTDPEVLAFRKRYRRPEWGMISAVPSGILPSYSTYMLDLIRMQQTRFIEFISGVRSLDQFDAFVEEWYARGGDILTAEANEIWKLRDMIYAEMGVRP